MCVIFEKMYLKKKIAIKENLMFLRVSIIENVKKFIDY